MLLFWVAIRYMFSGFWLDDIVRWFGECIMCVVMTRIETLEWNGFGCLSHKLSQSKVGNVNETCDKNLVLKTSHQTKTILLQETCTCVLLVDINVNYYKSCVRVCTSVCPFIFIIFILLDIVFLFLWCCNIIRWWDRGRDYTWKCFLLSSIFFFNMQQQCF